MVNDTKNYELMPLDEVKRLKEEISELKKEKHYAPSSVVAQSLDRLANSLENLFKIFDVAATDIEQETLHKKSFEEHMNPILEKLTKLEEQNRDLAEGMLALADIVKKLEKKSDEKDEKIVPYGKSQLNPQLNSNQELPPLEPMPPSEPVGSPRPLGGLPPITPNKGVPPPLGPLK